LLTPKSNEGLKATYTRPLWYIISTKTCLQSCGIHQTACSPKRL